MGRTAASQQLYVINQPLVIFPFWELSHLVTIRQLSIHGKLKQFSVTRFSSWHQPTTESSHSDITHHSDIVLQLLVSLFVVLDFGVCVVVFVLRLISEIEHQLISPHVRTQFKTVGCGHGIGIIWNQRDVKATPALLACSLGAGVCWHGTPARALISRDAVDTSRIPAVWRLTTAHHGLSAMPAASALLACSVRASADTGHPHVRVSSWTWMTIVSQRTLATAVGAGF